jgi:hypothetical protein
MDACHRPSAAAMNTIVQPGRLACSVPGTERRGQGLSRGRCRAARYPWNKMPLYLREVAPLSKIVNK